MVVTFKEENTITFKHLFLKDYAEGSEDTYAVYTQAGVYDHIFYAVDKVRRVTGGLLWEWGGPRCGTAGHNQWPCADSHSPRSTWPFQTRR